MTGYMKSKEVLTKLDELYPNPKCELNYNKDYELLIAVVLSAQCTDKRVNSVTKELFSKYTLKDLSEIDNKKIEKIIYPLGTYTKKAEYIKQIAKALINDCDGKVINDRKYLENLPGVGRKTCNVVLGELFNEPSIAVDTHVSRVAYRLELTKSKDVLEIEKDLMKIFPKDKWVRVHKQLVLFGRYMCKSIKPECSKCPFQCKYKR